MRHAVVQLVLLTCTVHAVAGSVAVQWTEAEGGNGHWYDRQTIPSGITWIDAGLAAFNNGGHLVTLTSIEENQFVYDSLVVTGNGNIGDWGPWIGARADGTSWHWAITGEPWNYEAWAENEPGSNDDTKAGGYWNHDGGIAQWADHLVDTELLSYIVEYSADCNGDGIVDYGQILDGTFADLDDNGIPDCCDDHTCDSTVIWNTADGGNGHGYQVVFSPDGISWTEARAAAEAAGGHLATVGSAAELEFINTLDFSGLDKGWLGGYQNMAAADYAEPDGGWRWVTGEPWSFVGWFSDAPADDPDRNYLQLAYGQCQDEQDLANEGEWYVIEYGTAESMEWSTNDGGNGHYYTTHISTVAWLEANAACQAIGAHLATVTTPEENQIIYAMSQPIDELWVDGTFNGPWLGGYQDPAAPDYSEPGGGWRWVTGEPWIYTNWQPGQPDDNNGNFDEWHLQYWKRNVDTWNDTWVTSNVLGYVLEWSADCNGDGIVDFGQILDGSLEDLDTNGVPDCCDDESCLPVASACCLAGDCSELTYPSQCDDLGGLWFEGLTCADVTCPTGTIDVCPTCDFQIIQTAINYAAEGDEILVYPGTYTGLPGATNIIETAGKAVEIRSSGGPEVTILDAGNNWGLRGMRCDSGETAATVLEGFTITGGNEIKGGGIFCDNNSNPTIINCVITQNTVTDQGGGVYFASCSPTLVDCTISNNFCGNHGGGFFCYDSNTTITNCTISGNMADVHDGGGIYFSSGTPNLTGCTISGNSANDDGGGLFCDETNANITDCEIMGNSASQGAGVYCYTNAAPIITNCTISGNTASNNGGGIYSNGSNPALADTTLCGNAPDQILGNWTDLEGNSFSGICPPIQWSEANGGNDHWYQSVRVGPYLSWQEAWDLATARGGELATPVTEEEDLWIINTLLADDSLWGYNGYYAYGPHIGGWQNFDSPDYSEPGGGWEWFSGETFDYTNWVNLDNCCGGQARMQYFKEETDGVGDIGWDDVAISGGEVLHQSYVIEWSADCNGDGIVDYGQILDGSYEDLNGNGILDCCDDGSCLDDGDPTTSQWTNPAGGDFHDPDNWSTSQPPAAGSTVILELDASYGISFQDDAQTLNLVARSGNVTLDLAGHSYTAANDNSTAIIGESSGDQAVLTVTSGMLVIGSGASGDAELLLGYGDSSLGNLRVSGAGASLSLHKLQVGDRGMGLMTIEGGASTQVGRVSLGNTIGSEGRLQLSGSDTSLTAGIEFSVNHGSVDIDSPAELRFVNPDAPMTIFKDGLLTGDGTITGYLLNRGTFAPDMSETAFQVLGDYRNRGVFITTLGETMHSRLEVSSNDEWYGEARLAGGLLVQLDQSFLPEIDDEFEVLLAEDRVRDTFDVAFMPDLGADRYMTVRYPGDGLRGGDENVDLVVVGFDDYLGFDEPVPVVLVGQPEAMAVADLDNDNDDDIAVSTTGMVSIYFNDDGVFDTYVQVENGNATSVDLVAGDFNGDGFLDLAGTNAVDNSVTIIISNGNGSFMTAVDLDTGAGTNPQGLTAADFNNDNRDDLAISCTGTGQVKLWRSQASGGLRDLVFNEDAVIDVGNAPIGIDPGEVEEDKDLDLIDLVVALNGEGKVGVLRNNSTSEMIEFLFDPADDKHVVGQGPTSVALADLDGDTHVDIVTANPDDGSISILLHGERSAAEFLGSVDLPVGTDARSVALADLDDDGDQDIALIAIGEDDGTFELYVLRNDSNLTNYEQLLIAPAENINITGIPVLVDDGDLDSDGVPDLVTINDAGSGLRSEPGTLGLVRSDPALVCPEDLDGNGFVDVDDVLLLLSNWNNPYTVDDLLELLGAWGPCR